MTTPIHIFCAYFMDIGRWEVNEAMCCFGDKKVSKMRFLPPFCFNLASEVCTGVCCDPTSLV